MDFDTLIYVLELVSITAISIIGAMIGVKERLDAFGVISLGVVSSLGGGVMRDLIIGITPPFSFGRPLYALTAAVFSALTFLLEYRHAKLHLRDDPRADKWRDVILLIIDTIGLGTFTVVGVAVPFQYVPDCNRFTIAFVGALTGVGGGILRDIIVGRKPYIFVKHFYATACIIGSVTCTLLWTPLGKVKAMIIGGAVIIILRFLAAKFRWNAPSVPYPKEESEREPKRMEVS